MVVPLKMSSPSVFLPLTPLRKQIGPGACRPSLDVDPRPLTTVTCFRNGSSGFRIGENSKPAPVVGGRPLLGMIAPCGT